MRRVLVIAAASVLLAAAAAAAFLEISTDRDGLGIKQRLWCRDYVDTLRSESDRQRLVAWADQEIFPRDFAEDDLRLGHYAGPRMASHTLDTRKGKLTVPEWMPAHYEIRFLGNTGSEFSSIFITGGRYRGLVVVRKDWDQAFDGKHLRPGMILAREGRVGLVCYVD